MQLWEKLEGLVSEWRDAHYVCDFPAVSEILLFQRDESGSLKFLREPQFRALETYWFLRVKLDTPRFLDLYKHLYDKRSERFNALGVEIGQDYVDFDSDDEYLKHIAAQKGTLQESLNLDYASYILALTMGAGKTVLIGTIIASEFALSLDTGDDRFMKNALVFAPGKTIIESLKEISVIPYDKILPPRLAKKFFANVKLIYTQDGNKDIQAQEGSSYNLIVTNTEKIALRKRSIRKGQMAFDYENQLAHDALIANQRLNKIASLPALGVFSDEAHHTYGNSLESDLKRVRETINHLHKQTNLICVVNTTGTPYAGNQTLKDVVFWYGLDQGIKDNVLKSLNRSINTYTFSDQTLDDILEDVITDFFTKYKDTQLITGQQAKIAFYFKSQQHLDESRAIIERALAKIGESPSLILMNTQQSTKKEVDEFNRLNDPNATKRVILLVGKGTEGWNCPSLFATALIRELTSSNNFILQASTRCLRQVDGNTQTATIYIESRNQRVLNAELQKTFGTSLTDLNNTEPKTQEMNLVFRKTTYPKLEITRTVRRVIAGERTDTDITLTKPTSDEDNRYTKEIYSPVSEKSGVLLSSTGEESEIVITEESVDIFTAAKQIADKYHRKTGAIYTQLQKLYNTDMPRAHMTQLFDQVEAQTTKYEEVEEQITEALALIKFVDDNGEPTFKKDRDGAYYHTIRYSAGKEKLFAHRDEYTARNPADFGFHYNPYNFDSEPEKEFLGEMLERLQVKQDEIEDIYFTGGVSNPAQTDLHFEYKGEDGRYHQYYPDFVIVKKNGEFLIVEIKAEGKETDPEVQAKAKAVEKLAKIKANKFRYHILYTSTPIPTTKLTEVVGEMEKIS
jgi:hypothetical protein